MGRDPNDSITDTQRKRNGFHNFLFIVVMLYGLLEISTISSTQLHPGQSIALGLAAIGLSTVAIRQEHAGHVYTLWYLFWLTTCCVVPAVLYLDLWALIPSSPPVLQSVWNWYIETSTDISSETRLLLLLVGVIAVPQVLSFLVSGLFGCGTRPVFIAKSARFALLGLVKFSCVFSGITFASSVLALLYSRTFGAIFQVTTGHGLIYHLTRSIASSCVWLSFAFILSLVYLRSATIPCLWRASIGSIRLVKSIEDYMTRYTKCDANGAPGLRPRAD